MKLPECDEAGCTEGPAADLSHWWTFHRCGLTEVERWRRNAEVARAEGDWKETMLYESLARGMPAPPSQPVPEPEEGQKHG
ncbi:MAG: hypothetical protein AB7G37_03330 [Solirubrobacteraceae bacterium]